MPRIWEVVCRRTGHVSQAYSTPTLLIGYGAFYLLPSKEALLSGLLISFWL